MLWLIWLWFKSVLALLALLGKLMVLILDGNSEMRP